MIATVIYPETWLQWIAFGSMLAMLFGGLLVAWCLRIAEGHD